MTGHAHKMIGYGKEVDYIIIRKVMIQGDRMINEFKEMARTTCDGCKALVQNVIDLGR